MENSIVSHIVKDRININPTHLSVRSWIFDAFEDDQDAIDRAQSEAELVNAMAKIATQNGISRNELQHIFPCVLRMLKSTSDWIK